MSVEEIKAIMRLYVEELVNKGNLDIADEIIHPNTRNPRGTGMWTKGPESVKEAMASGHKSFSDLHREIKDMVVEGNKVVLYSTYTGTHTGVGGFGEYRPTGASVEMNVVATFLIEDGKIIEEPWNCYNMNDTVHPMTKGVVRCWIEEIWNQGKVEIIEDIISSDYVLIDPTMPGITGLQGAKDLIELSRQAAPDLHTTIEDIMADGDKVITRWSAQGTQQGEFMSIAPSGKQFTISGTSIFRFDKGKIVEEWKNWDALGLMKQLGAISNV